MISDFHTEFVDIIHSAPYATDVVVLAGDIGKGGHGVRWAKKSFPDKPVVYVAGNHEYYLGDISDVEQIRKQAEAAGIHFLEKEVAVIDGVRFLGCTLWSNIQHWSQVNVDYAKLMMNDYQYITAKQWWKDQSNCDLAARYLNQDKSKLSDYEMFEPVVSYIIHNQSLGWLIQQLQEPFAGKTVIVTHHAPSFKSTENETSEKRLLLNASYASDLEKMILEYRHVINLWVHGHIHHAVNYQIHGVPIRSNPRGYPVFNPLSDDQPFGFDAKLLLEI